MKSLVCEKCGGNDLRREAGYLVCAYCGTKYVIDNTNRALRQATVDLGGDVERLLQKCRTDPKHAQKYANLILDIDPTNAEALKYL